MNPSPLPTPDLEPILYFYTHSLLVMASAAVLFFLLGLWFGWLTWARHKRRARAFQEETTLLRHEIATLKRRIAEEAVDEALLMPVGDDANALMHHVKPVSPPKMTLARPIAEPGPESLAAAMLMAASTPLVPTAFPETIKATTGALPLKNGTTTTDSAATDSHHVPMVVPAVETKLTPVAVPSAGTTGLKLSEPKKESTTIVLPVPGRETASVPLVSTPRPMTGPIQLPMLPELMEAPGNGVEVVHAFAAELAAGMVRVDDRLGVLYAARPDRWDDLTLLRGVAEGLQARLHDTGIYTFKQIAMWTEDNMRDVGQHIQAKERILRDLWVQQARELHYLKYGEKVGE